MTPNHSQLQELRATLGKMEIALGAVDTPIVWTDEHGIIQWCNKSFNREANQNDTSPPIIIIALTANARTEDSDRCLAAGMNDFLSNPLRKEDLEMRLNYWLQVVSQRCQYL